METILKVWLCKEFAIEIGFHVVLILVSTHIHRLIYKRMLSRFGWSRWVTHQRLFTRPLSMKGCTSYLTDDNIMVGNDTLEYPKGDLFSVFSKKFEEFGDKKAVVSVMIFCSLYVLCIRLLFEEKRKIKCTTLNKRLEYIAITFIK